MNELQIGLALNFVGTVIIGVSSQLGQATAYGGPIVWKKGGWRFVNILGWLLLAAGFAIQYWKT